MRVIYITPEQAVETHRKTIEYSGGGDTSCINIGYLHSVLEHIHRGEIVDVEICDVRIIRNQLPVCLEVEYFGAEECILSHGVHLISQYRIDAEIGTVLEINTQ